jgi:hypothetical protein
MLKKPSERARTDRQVASEDQAEALARQLADKPYGTESRESPQASTSELNAPAAGPYEKLARTTISLPESLLRQCEDIALSNKRAGLEPKNVSALLRAALEVYLNK